MGWLDDLLTGRAPELETRSLSTISPEQRASLDALIAQLQGRTPAAFSGQAAPLSPFERSSLTALEQRSQALAMPDPTLEAAGGAVRSLTDFEGQTGDASEFFRTNVQDPLLQSFQREILPQISRQFGGADFFSTERQGAEGLARQDLVEALAGSKSAVELEQFNRSRDRALTASGLAPGLSAAENARTQSQMDILRAAGIEREVEQGGLDREYAEFVRQQQRQSQQETLLAQLGLTPTIENIGMTDPGNAGIVNLLLGGAAGGLGDILGERGGDWLSNLLGRLFGGKGPDAETPSGESPADNMPPGNTGTTVTDIPLPIPAGGTLPTAPGGSVTITDPTTGEVIPSTPTEPPAGFNLPGGGLAGGLAGGVGAGLLGGATTPAGEVIISDILGNVIGGGAAAGGAGAGTAAGGGIAAGTGAGAGGGLGGGGAALGAGAGAAAALGIFAIPLILAAVGLAGDKNARMNRYFTEGNITPLSTARGPLYMLGDQTFIEERYIEELFQLSKDWGNPDGRQRYEQRLAEIPRVEYKIPSFPGAGAAYAWEEAPMPTFNGPRRNLL